MRLEAVILTFNEGKHLRRCISSLTGVADRVLVVDSFSSDDTVMIATECGARILQRKWLNYADQFNWALANLDSETNWVLRIDADEFLTPALANEIRTRLPSLGDEIDGVTCGRRMIFQGQLIRFGGVFPVRLIRLFRPGRGECENRWMDEHIKVTGPTVDFTGDLIDENLNSITWWTEKHNQYASREAVDLLNLEYGFAVHDSVADLGDRSEATIKRRIKERVYAKLPLGSRAFFYFVYRYVFRLGFLDRNGGANFHLLQGFWYRYLVDAKVSEVKREMKLSGDNPKLVIRRVLGIELQPR
ncbi:glycosyltransferase family 2 protein [Mesorhizobium sp. M0898]|uniref:glycosyltransferase family 2 protein n=1 Tax=Mesorhizobium sp. M0898 TaxID=2957020 RepID=UPI00333CE059